VTFYPQKKNLRLSPNELLFLDSHYFLDPAIERRGEERRAPKIANFGAFFSTLKFANFRAFFRWDYKNLPDCKQRRMIVKKNPGNPNPAYGHRRSCAAATAALAPPS
jgi:hypothetical protein